MLKITKYKVINELPNPFLFDDGRTVKTVEDWKLRKKEIYKYAVDLQFGGMPPEPEFLDVICLNKGKSHSTYKIYTGTREKPISFLCKMIMPVGIKRPIIISGDMCAGYFMKEDYINKALDKNIGWLLFDRTEIASDIGNNKKMGQIFETYPNLSFGVLSAWAWAYLRVVDALEKLSLDSINLKYIAITGHSRGGKATLLAGAVDERIAIVNPNEACLCGGGCYRIEMEAKYNESNLWRSETLSDIWKNSSSWIGQDMERYIGRVQELPFDTHYLKGMVAPRILFVSEATGDIWANPIGSWMTTMACGEIYKLLNKKENLYWYFRDGFHYHKAEDIEMLVNIISHLSDGEKINESFYNLPFEEQKLIYGWKFDNEKEDKSNE